MNYLKLTVKITPFEDWLRDVLTAQLSQIGFESFAETEDGFDGFIPENNFDEKRVTLLLKTFEKNRSFNVHKELIEEKNWNEEWEKNYFKPLVIAGECLVRAPFHKEFPRCKYEIVIEPNMAFGTGNHETTSMMLEAILKEEVTGKSVLDMGCGTGILGILASMKGAGRIRAVDIDNWSVKGTHENSIRNHIENLKVQKGDASVLGDEKYDLILANIQKNVLLNDLPVYSKCMNANGLLLMSGFYQEDLNDIKNCAAKQELIFVEHEVKNSWTMAVFKKP